MQFACPPYLTTGFAVIGTGLIAISPVVSPHSKEPVEHRATALTANAYYGLGTLIDTTAANLKGLIQGFTAYPFPVLSQVLTNQATYAADFWNAGGASLDNLGYSLGALPAGLSNFAEDIAGGNVLAGIGNASSALLRFPEFVLGPWNQDALGPMLYGMANGANMIATQGSAAIEYLLYYAATDPIRAASMALAAIAQNIFDDWDTGNYLGVFDNIVNLPTSLTEAFLNGYTIGNYGGYEYYYWFGLLTNPDGVNPSWWHPLSSVGGTFANLGQISQVVAQLIHEPAAPVVAELSADFAGLSAMLNPADLAASIDPALLADIPATLLNLIP